MYTHTHTHTHKANSISINNTGNACITTHTVAHLHNYCSQGTKQCIFFNTVLEVQNILYCLYFPTCPNSLMHLDCRDLLYDIMLLSTIQMCLGVLSKKWKYFSIQFSPDFYTSIVVWKVLRLHPFTEPLKVCLNPSEKFVWAPSKGRSAKSTYVHTTNKYI